MSLQVTRLSPTTAAAAPQDPQAQFQEKLAGYLTRHVNAGTLSQLPDALGKAVGAKGNAFDSSVLLKSRGSIDGVAQPAIAIIDVRTKPNPDLVLHHPRKPNDGYVLVAGAVGSQNPLRISAAVDISTPSIAALKAKLKSDPAFNAQLAACGARFSDVKFVVGDVIGKKAGAEFVGEFTDAGVGRYGAYVPGEKGKPSFAQNFLVNTKVTQFIGRESGPVLRASVESIKQEKL